MTSPMPDAIRLTTEVYTEQDPQSSIVFGFASWNDQSSRVWSQRMAGPPTRGLIGERSKRGGPCARTPVGGTRTGTLAASTVI